MDSHRDADPSEFQIQMIQGELRMLLDLTNEIHDLVSEICPQSRRKAIRPRLGCCPHSCRGGSRHSRQMKMHSLLSEDHASICRRVMPSPHCQRRVTVSPV